MPVQVSTPTSLSPFTQNTSPFRHSDKESLYTTLHSDKLAAGDIEDIIQLASAGQYSAACKLHHTARVKLVLQASDKTNNPTEVIKLVQSAHELYN